MRAALVCASLISASAQSLFDHNLIVNGGAETGVGTDGSTAPASIPGWLLAGSPRVVSYASGYDLLPTGIVPRAHRDNYFVGGLAASASTLSQSIDTASATIPIDAGTVVFDISGYLGGRGANTAVITATFLNGASNPLGTVSLGPVIPADKAANSALYFRRQVGTLPQGTRSISVTLQFNRSGTAANDGYADVLSLILTNSGNSGTVLETNLIYNAGAESAVAGTATQVAGDVPNWVRTADFSTDSYADVSGDLNTSNIRPPKPGDNYFWGGVNNALSSAVQDIDISPATGLIDSGRVNYSLMAWLGGIGAEEDNAVLKAEFKRWDGTVLLTATLGPVTAADRGNRSGLFQRIQTAQVPQGARVVRLTMTMTRVSGTNNDGLADNLSLILSSSGVPAQPVILPDGVMSASEFGGFPAVAPGSWVEIYGANLSAVTGEWTWADFTGSTAPTVLNGVSVTIGGQRAFVRYTSPGQVNVQVPAVNVGTQPLVLTNAVGSTQAYSVNVVALQPGLLAPASLLVNGLQYVFAQHSDYSLVLPAGTLPGVVSRPAQPGETITFYGIGFGPVTPTTLPGQVAAGLTQLVNPPQFAVGGLSAQVSYAGLAPGLVGLYQFNVVVPNAAASSFVPVKVSVNDIPVGQQLYLAVSP